MYTIDSIDMISIKRGRNNQKKLNEAYNILDDFKDELIREKIKNRRNKRGDTRGFKEL